MMEYDWLERRLMDSHRTIESLISRFESLSEALAATPELGWIQSGFSAEELGYICEALRLAIAARDAIRSMRIENNELREKLGEVMHLRNCIAAKHLQLEGLVRGKRYSIVRDSVPMTVNGEDLKATDVVKGEVRLDKQIVTCVIKEYEDTGILVCSECGAMQPDDHTVYYCWCCGRKVEG